MFSVCCTYIERLQYGRNQNDCHFRQLEQGVNYVLYHQSEIRTTLNAIEAGKKPSTASEKLEVDQCQSRPLRFTTLFSTFDALFARCYAPDPRVEAAQIAR